jgi:hypothetical protein
MKGKETNIIEDLDENHYLDTEDVVEMLRQIDDVCNSCILSRGCAVERF